MVVLVLRTSCLQLLATMTAVLPAAFAVLVAEPPVVAVVAVVVAAAAVVVVVVVVVAGADILVAVEVVSGLLVGLGQGHKPPVVVVVVAAVAVAAALSVVFHYGDFPSLLAASSPLVGFLPPFAVSQFRAADSTSQSAPEAPSENSDHHLAAIAAAVVGRQPAAAWRSVADGQS